MGAFSFARMRAAAGDLTLISLTFAGHLLTRSSNQPLGPPKRATVNNRGPQGSPVGLVRQK